MIGKLTDEQIDEVLQRNVLGRIGCNDGNKNYVVPINYVYDGKNIIAHSVMGMKIEMMRKNPSVCFEVDTMESFTKWKSVIAWGEYQELTDESARYYAMKMFVDKMMHIKVSSTATPPEVNKGRVHPVKQSGVKPIIYRIIIFEKTGRFEND
jgi:uncharacterized protein